jgi:hypothetical protein
MANLLNDSPASAGPLEEVANILAIGLQRLFDRKSSRKLHGIAETPLDCRGPSEGHVGKRAEDKTP